MIVLLRFPNDGCDLGNAAALFGLPACRDVESEKIDHVNDLIRAILCLVSRSGAHRDKRQQDSLALDSPLLPNSRRFAHEMRISNYFCRIVQS
jgi:hypothetical protein